MSISAKSAASMPPAPARMVTTASRGSYSPVSRVRISSWLSGVPERDELLLGLGPGVGVGLVAGELDEDLEVVDPRAHLLQAVQLGLGGGQLAA